VKVNHFICPNCGHDFYSNCAYATCDSCNTMFYASQSRTNQNNHPYESTSKTTVTINGMPPELFWRKP